jgi:hypothetical protein
MIYSHYPKSHDPGAHPDRRNGPARAYSQEFEERYRDEVEAGRFEDRFHVPSVSS